jgi:hypothetical protein
MIAISASTATTMMIMRFFVLDLFSTRVCMREAPQRELMSVFARTAW